MANFRKQLPPMSTLIAFESAARNLSFTRAADELNLTQAAISRQVRLLEENLGISLFTRSHRAVHLTKDGRNFQHSVSDVLERLAYAAEELRSQNHSKTVSVAADMAIASFWLMPRLKKFRNEHPEISIRVVASDDNTLVLDEGIDVAIQLGKEDKSESNGRFLFETEVFPVCSPDYLNKCPPFNSAKDLLNATLLRLDDEHWDWLDWPAWFTLNQVMLQGSRNDLYINNYPLVIQGALTGQGLALGWQHLVEEMLDSGALIRPIEATVRTKRGFYLVLPEETSHASEVNSFCDWLIKECSQ